MGAVLSARSKGHLALVHVDLRLFVYGVAADGVDVEVICGHRGKVEQDRAYREGTSKLPWPKSAHNKMPSHAVDLLPREIIKGKVIEWDNIAAFKKLAQKLKSLAPKYDIDLVWGGDWKTLKDYPHWELMTIKSRDAKS